METETPATPAPVSPAAPQMSAFGRIIGVLANPKEAFADIARAPRWLVPCLVLTLTGLGISVALVQRADWAEVTRQQIEKNKFAARQFEQLNPEQRQQAYQRAATQAKVMRYVRGAIGSLLLIVIFGGIYLLAFNLAGGAGIKYKTALAVVAHGYLPLGIQELIGIPVQFLKDPASIDPENFLASNVAAFLPSDAPLWQIALGASVDLFGIWAMILLAIGFAATNPKKLSFGKSLGIVLGVVMVLTLFFTGLAGLFS